eukprot:COSAG01_NODE_1365_length_10560_cov_38.008986_7_plen_250_part_00
MSTCVRRVLADDVMVPAPFQKKSDTFMRHKGKQSIRDATLAKWIADLLCDGWQIYNDDLAAVQFKDKRIVLDKPIYCGLSILDLSKLHMYRFHYDVIKRKYGDRAWLLFTDTDSLCYHIRCDDFYQDMLLDRDLYDLSNYPKGSPFHDPVIFNTITRHTPLVRSPMFLEQPPPPPPPLPVGVGSDDGTLALSFGGGPTVTAVRLRGRAVGQGSLPLFAVSDFWGGGRSQRWWPLQQFGAERRFQPAGDR